MTRKEAIEELSILLNKYQDGHFGDALDMAITALEQKPKTRQKCQDCKFWRLDKNDENKICRYCYRPK